ncbi:hypothetical protein ACFSCX_11130 [Bacillus salitolerans]|uniref:DUF2627 domain-containing protein n=1 Tax=Bacillus salitolerans TaxID=1437434 RepID=A0ABW4LPH7_9BACI
MKNRLILCLLICAVLMYYAIPRITLHFSGVDGVFAFFWLILALFVIGGNLAGLLYSQKKNTRRKEMGRYRSKHKRKFLSEH